MPSSNQDQVLDVICAKVRSKHPEPEWYDFIATGALYVSNRIGQINEQEKAVDHAAAVLVSSIDMLKSITENKFTEVLRQQA